MLIGFEPEDQSISDLIPDIYVSNILLDEVDREIERRGHRFVRYADDSNVYVQSKAAGG
jgi:retron-type reverse transcriptase